VTAFVAVIDNCYPLGPGNVQLAAVWCYWISPRPGLTEIVAVMVLVAVLITYTLFAYWLMAYTLVPSGLMVILSAAKPMGMVANTAWVTASIAYTASGLLRNYI